MGHVPWLCQTTRGYDFCAIMGGSSNGEGNRHGDLTNTNCDKRHVC